ncbi:hypothetical protein [Psychrobacillus antarcticus]|uniref:hypothetical protein n=1 Tax=Psychrobacillus antarcticus TaxID=2879115 RepID=UPI00240810F2|nr:hypothetical protein [Psychrobacillus antarcticus]
MTLVNCYFLKTGETPLPKAHLIGFSHAYQPVNQLIKETTIIIDLTKSEEQLLKDLHRTNRKQIRQAAKYDFQIEVLDRPTLANIREFQTFYNEFVKHTNTYKCGAFHIKTMELLMEASHLIITRIVNGSNREILGYQVFITDDETAFSLYSATHFRFKNNAIDKRILSIASRYLLWRNILYFKDRKNLVYDMGGLTTNDNISSFKREFGGKITDVYSGYEASSLLGKLVLLGRTMKLRKG